MEFKLKISNEERPKLIKLINTKYAGSTYGYDEFQTSDEETSLIVNCQDDQADNLVEDIMEDFDSVSMELIISNELFNINIKSVLIYSNGTVAVTDDKDNPVTDLEGQWQDKFREILTLDNDTTSLKDNRQKRG
jgi:hypothetical protein